MKLLVLLAQNVFLSEMTMDFNHGNVCQDGSLLSLLKKKKKVIGVITMAGMCLTEVSIWYINFFL